MSPERAEPAADCLDDDVIAALVDGALDETRRAQALSHVVECGRCTGLVGSVVRATADSAVAGEIARLHAPVRRRLYLAALPLAAAAAVLLWIVPRGDEGLADRHRAPTIHAAAAPIPLEPSGVVANATSFRWRAVAAARQYRVTLFDDRGGVVYETQTSDTVATLPNSIILSPGRAYLWKIEANTGFDRFVASDLVEFSVAPRPPR